MKDTSVEQSYQLARERYAELGVATETALDKLAGKALSLPCWQGDDVGGFETPDANLSGGGLQVTGSHPGRARTIEALRRYLEKALSLIPGKHRVNLHSIYGEFDGARVERDHFRTEHFAGWIDWAESHSLKLDFNATLFSHPKAKSGFTLSSKDPAIREFWIEHVNCCRRIAHDIGKKLGDTCIHNLWIPDGMKDSCVDREGFRRILKASLDEIFARHRVPDRYCKDSLEPKLFGIGSESFVVGSYEFYLGYVLTHEKRLLCLDLGHFHPTESVADKLSALLLATDELLLHVSRGVRWDSDHVAVFDDPLREVALEIVRNNALDRVHLALDYFDASINRIAAWVVGARATLKALLFALLEPRARLVECEARGDFTARLVLLEAVKSLPLGAIWDYYCLKNGVALDSDWLAGLK